MTSDTPSMIASVRGAEPYPRLDGAWRITWPMHKHTFNHVVALAGDGERAIHQCQRDDFDDRLARCVVDYARAHESRVFAGSEHVFLEDFTAPGFSFDGLVAVSPKVHGALGHVKPLHAKMVSVFPGYRCEVALDSPNDEFRERYRRGWPWSDIKRDPYPVIRMRFHNHDTGVKSRGKRLFVAKLEDLYRELAGIRGNEASYVEFENFAGQRRFVTGGQTYTVKGDGHVQKVSRGDLEDWAKNFLIRGA